MRARVAMINLTTSGQEITPSRGVTLIVGPNNVGKSAVLARIQQEMVSDPNQQSNPQPQVVSSINVSLPPAQEYLATIEKRARLFPAGSNPSGIFYEPTFVFQNGQTVTQSAVLSLLSRSDRFGPLATAMMVFMGPEGRGGILGSQGLPDLMVPVSNRTPMQMLWGDRVLEDVIDRYMQRAFGQRLLVNRHAGANIHLHIGETATPEPRIGTSSPYLSEVARLPLLATQGSGMQAFMGTLLTLATGTFDIVLLDEPEAFLHPPQARLLGEVVAEMSRDTGLQAIVATHSDDFVQGVINASRDDAEVSVVRITRPMVDANHVAQVEPDSIKSLYRDPLLRYSKIMDGIFYKGVVICEAEADCTYYAATLSHIETVGSAGASDLLFTQCGGKDRLYRAYEALASAAVPTAVIADVDLLADKSKFVKIFETMGGSFPAIEASYNTLVASIRNLRVAPQRSKVRPLLLKIIDGSTSSEFSGTELESIQELLKAESGWKQVKKKGSGAIDTGDPTAAFDSIVAACKAIGLFILTIGELERFHPEISGNKQEWLRKVLEKESFKSSTAAQNFVSTVRDFVSTKQ